MRLSVLVFLVFSIALTAQNQIWYFGDKAGIDFNTSPPTALTNSQMYAEEGCSSISDQNGNLLFYTDGIKIWNRNHIIMPNGNGLMGNPSTSQGALIIPDPGDSNLYYVFSIDELAGANGMRYSKVDMTLQGGMGDVTTKNVLLHSSVAEKMVAVRRCDGNIWVISHEWNSNKFFADLITPVGISPTVSSSVGTSHTGGGRGVINAVGYMAISQQGDKLAVAMRDANLFEVLDFDFATGSVSNPITLNSPSFYRSYGVEFSPDGTKLYGACISTGEVYQFDLTSGNANTIVSTAVQVGNFSNLAGGMKLGPDGKIYVAKSVGSSSGLNFLAVINNPDVLGTACNLSSNGINLSTGKSLLGVPNFLVDQKHISLDISGDTLICSGDTSLLMVSGSGNIQWVEGSSSTSPIISVTPTTTTVYKVADLSSVCKDTVSITVHVSKAA